MLRRWAAFLKERYLVHALPVALWAVAVDLAIQHLLGATPRLSGATLVVSATAVLMGAAARVTDEYKDAPVDRVLHPDRPFVAGRITERDMGWLTLATVAAPLALNLVWPLAVVELSAQILFLYLMTRWFFVPQIVSTNRILAIGSHVPYYVMLCYYESVFVSRYHGLDGPWHLPLALSGWMVLPFLSYEFARMTPTRAEEKPALQSYTTLLGPAGAALAGFAFAAAHFGVLFVVLGGTASWVVVALGVLLAAYAAVTVRFALGRAGSGSELAAASGAYYLPGLLLLCAGALRFL